MIERLWHIINQLINEISILLYNSNKYFLGYKNLTVSYAISTFENLNMALSGQKV